MTQLVSTSRDGLSQIADQRSGDHGWHRGAHYNAPLRASILGRFEINPARNAQKLVPHLNGDAFNEVTGDDLGLGHSWGRDRFGHLQISVGAS